jgi:hypothetical protein
MTSTTATAIATAIATATATAIAYRVRDAIDHSVLYNETAVLDCHHFDYENLYYGLLVECEDDAEDISHDAHDFWGERDGQPWSVRLIHCGW